MFLAVFRKADRVVELLDQVFDLAFHQPHAQAFGDIEQRMSYPFNDKEFLASV